jgi:hypothetical protein
MAQDRRRDRHRAPQIAAAPPRSRLPLRGRPGPGEMTSRSGRMALMSWSCQPIVAHDLDLGAQLTQAGVPG